MTSRMDRYRSSQVESNQPIHSRSKKNEQLYEQIYTNKIFTEFTNAKIENAIDMTSVSNSNDVGREQYQKNRMLNANHNMISTNNSSTTFPNFSNELENNAENTEKNYDINDVLDQAKKNRKLEDDFEKKRRLKNVEYSILSDLSQERLKEYHDQKQKLSKEEEDNLEELIHTITSNSLRKKIDDELLSDLMPSEESETIISKELLEQLDEMEEKHSQLNEELEAENKIDDSFYTRSMDLSKEDFEIENDEEDFSFLEDKKMKTFPKIMIVLFILIIIGIIVYVIYRFI